MTTFNLFAGWDAEGEDDTKKILDDKFLDQESMEEEETLGEEGKEDTLDEAQNGGKDNEVGAGTWGSMVGFLTGGSKDEDGGMDVNALIETARAFTASNASGETADTKSESNMDDFRKEVMLVRAQLEKKFADVQGLDKLDLTSFLYFLEREDKKKNPSWKRRKHRFCNGLALDTVHALHDALYLTELTYVDTVEQVQKGIENYVGEPYELIYATCGGKPREPAHFLAIKKEAPQKEKKQSFFGNNDTYLEVLLVVRGTKEVADMLSDALLEASEYRDGLAHDGIMKSGKFLVEKHLALLNHLLSKTNRKKVKITLIGHSLGAGAAAIACMEFNDQPNMEASCIAFCCPAVVDKATSEKWKSKITTVVCDSDCVPRMSGATLANVLMAVSEHDWKASAREDISQLLDFVSYKVPLLLPAAKVTDTMAFIVSKMEEKFPDKPKGLVRHELELFPPGKCVHFYRDGIGISAVEVRCDFFDEVDVSRTMVDDHYPHTGLHVMFTQLMRKHKKDSQFRFRNDLLGLRWETPIVVVVEEDAEKK